MGIASAELAVVATAAADVAPDGVAVLVNVAITTDEDGAVRDVAAAADVVGVVAAAAVVGVDEEAAAADGDIDEEVGEEVVVAAAAEDEVLVYPFSSDKS